MISARYGNLPPATAASGRNQPFTRLYTLRLVLTHTGQSFLRRLLLAPLGNMVQSHGSSFGLKSLLLGVLSLVVTSPASAYYYVYSEWDAHLGRAECSLRQSYRFAAESDPHSVDSPTSLNVEDVLGGFSLYFFGANRALDVGDIRVGPRELAVKLYAEGPSQDNLVDALFEDVQLGNAAFQFVEGKGSRRTLVALGDDAANLLDMLEQEKHVTMSIKLLTGEEIRAGIPTVKRDTSPHALFAEFNKCLAALAE